MSDYTFGNDFSVKDGLASGDPNKLILGSDMDSEFEAIETHIASKVDEPSNPEDGEVLQWDDNTSAVVWGRGLPIGFMGAYGGTSDPNDWLLCDGRAVARSGTYAALFAVIGTAFGAGDGSTTFNIPDLRFRAPVGPDDMGTAEGAASRDTSVTFDTGSGGVGSDGGNSRTTENVDHNHSVVVSTNTVSDTDTLDVYNGIGSLTGVELKTDLGTSAGTVAINSAGHAHSISSSTASAGDGASISNMQPFAVANWIIKYR